MFSYYGRKTKVIKYYPAPKYDTIIEPFAGSAVYSLYQDNWKKNVHLVDKYETIIRIWKYLQNASPNDILKLPDVGSKEKLKEINGFSQLIDEEKWLIGFCCNNGSSQPKNVSGQFNSWNKNKSSISSNLHKIKHWKIELGDYKDISNQKATWYVDSPYEFGGKWYKHKTIDFNHLAEWCKSREGQVIVCENTKANWLPFQPLKEMRGAKYTTTEAIWVKNCIIDNRTNN